MDWSLPIYVKTDAFALELERRIPHLPKGLQNSYGFRLRMSCDDMMGIILTVYETRAAKREDLFDLFIYEANKCKARLRLLTRLQNGFSDVDTVMLVNSLEDIMTEARKWKFSSKKVSESRMAAEQSSASETRRFEKKEAML